MLPPVCCEADCNVGRIEGREKAREEEEMWMKEMNDLGACLRCVLRSWAVVVEADVGKAGFEAAAAAVAAVAEEQLMEAHWRKEEMEVTAPDWLRRSNEVMEKRLQGSRTGLQTGVGEGQEKRRNRGHKQVIWTEVSRIY